MMKSLGLSFILGFHQFFYHDASVATLFIAKYVDDLLTATRNDEWLAWALRGIKRAFTIGSTVQAPETITMNSTEVEASHNMLVLHMRRFQKTEIELFSISPPRRRQVDMLLTAIEIRDVRRIAGKLGYLGTGVSPFAALAASYLQQCIPFMTVAGLKSANGIIRNVLRRTKVILYPKPSSEEQRHLRIVSFSVILKTKRRPRRMHIRSCLWPEERMEISHNRIHFPLSKTHVKIIASIRNYRSKYVIWSRPESATYI